MRRQTSYRRIAAELPEIGTIATTRQGEAGQVIAHEDGQARIQFAGSVQGLYSADEISWQVVGTQTEGRWQTEGAELHVADRDYPELTDILGRPAPALVQEGNEWGKIASKTASMDNTLHARLVMAVTEYDRKQEGKAGYNHYALPQYLGAIQRTQELCDDGHSVRAALMTCFSGRLLAAVLKAAGEPKPTDHELHFGSKTATDHDETCAVCGKDVVGNDADGWRHTDGSETVHLPMILWSPKNNFGQDYGRNASKTAETVTTYDPYNSFTPKDGDCETCFGEGAFSNLRSDGKGFDPEQTCPDCGGSGKAS